MTKVGKWLQPDSKMDWLSQNLSVSVSRQFLDIGLHSRGQLSNEQKWCISKQKQYVIAVY